MKMDFTFEIDELEIEVTKGAFTTISASLRVEASQNSTGDIYINTIEADCGAYDREANKHTYNWVRVDDEPQFQIFNAGVLKAAKYHAPERYGENPNAEHRLLASELV